MGSKVDLKNGPHSLSAAQVKEVAISNMIICKKFDFDLITARKINAPRMLPGAA